jgi:hypothetical protein
MIRCVMVFERNGTYHRIPDAEVEDWEELQESLETEPVMLGRVDGWPPYTHAFRLSEGAVYLVALRSQD